MQNIDNQSEEVKLAAVKLNDFMIKYISNPSEGSAISSCDG
jgi:hypothetical protein